MQTAVGVFGGEAYTDGMGVPPLMVANAGNSSRSAVSSLNCPPFIAVELCREQVVGPVAIYTLFLQQQPNPPPKKKRKRKKKRKKKVTVTCTPASMSTAIQREMKRERVMILVGCSDHKSN